MLLYNIRIAWKSMLRSPVLSLLLVLAIALGTGVATTFAAVRHAFARDPLPDKSARLAYVRLDAWDPAEPFPNPEDPGAPPPQITFQDMEGIMKSTIPIRQAAMFKSDTYVFPAQGSGQRPFHELVRLTTVDFFAMFEVPFRFGGTWTKDDDAKASPVVVLGAALNDRLFGGENSVGKTVKLRDHELRVVGVLAPWTPGIRFYDLTQRYTDPPEEIFVPLSLLVPMKFSLAGNAAMWGPTPAPGLEPMLRSEEEFLQMWVELEDRAAAAEYHRFLDDYTLSQRAHGRFLRPLNNRVTSLADWMEEVKVVPKETSAVMIVSLLFLAVCCVNLVGILLGKFLARAPEIGVRRALGASRLDIFLQHIVECEVLAAAGGALGLVFALGGLAAMNVYLRVRMDRADLFHLDTPMLAFSVGLALLAGLVAGGYPAYRVCRLAPAAHLKA